MTQERTPKRISRRDILWAAGGAGAGVFVGAVASQGLKTDKIIVKSPELQFVSEEERQIALQRLAELMREVSGSDVIEKFMRTAPPDEIKRAFIKEKNQLHIDSIGSGYLKDSWSLRLPPTGPTHPDTYWDPNYFSPTVVYFENPEGLDDPSTVTQVGGSIKNYAETERVQVYLDRKGKVRQGQLRGFDVEDKHFTPEEIDRAFRGFATPNFFDGDRYSLQPGFQLSEDVPSGYDIFREFQDGDKGVVWKMRRGYSAKGVALPFFQGNIDYNGLTYVRKITNISTSSSKGRPTPIPFTVRPESALTSTPAKTPLVW